MLAVAVAVVVVPLAVLRPAAAATVATQSANAAPAAAAAGRAGSAAAPSAAASTARPASNAASASGVAVAAAATGGSTAARAQDTSPFARAAGAIAGAAANLAAAARERGAEGDRCDGFDPARRRSGSTTSLNIDDGDGKVRRVEWYTRTEGRCAEAVVAGDVEFDDDETGVRRMGADGIAWFREHTSDGDRRVRFLRDGAAVRTEVTFDGRVVNDATSRAWVGTIVQDVLRESGIDAPARVRRMRSRGGTDAVLETVGRIRGAGARRAHYEALLEVPGFAPDEVERTIRHASRSLASNDGDLRGVLEHVPARALQSAGVRTAMVESVRSIDSDGDKRGVLERLVDTDDRTVLLLALEQTRAIDSDGDRRGVLEAAAGHALARDDAELRTAFFAAARGIDSDGDLSAVLLTAVREQGTPAVTAAVLDAVRYVDSDGDATRVLVTLARKQLLTTKALRDAYVAAARGISSEGDRSRALAALPGADGVQQY